MMVKFFGIFFTMAFLLSAFATEYPLRVKYPTTKPISLDKLNEDFEKATVLDVRSKVEYDVIHVKGSKHLLVSKSSFITDLKKLYPKKDHYLVTYCNGTTCAKSYKAALKAVKAGYTNIHVLDDGIFDWTMAYPEKSVLLGGSPVDKANLISKEDFIAKQLDKTQFAQKSVGADAVLIDARDPLQRAKSPSFAKKSKNIPFDRLIKLLENGSSFRKQNVSKTIYIFDAVGKQVRWLQYHLEKNGVKNYYFLKNGVWSIFGAKGATK